MWSPSPALPHALDVQKQHVLLQLAPYQSFLCTQPAQPQLDVWTVALLNAMWHPCDAHPAG